MGLYERLRIDVSGIGNTYGSWTQIGPSFSIRRPSGEKSRHALFQCDCGATNLIALNQINYGKSRTGCLECRKKKVGEYTGTHRMTNTPEYRAWESMLRRCFNPNVWNYDRYGGRGVTVCERWRHSYENFFQDVGPKPSRDYQLDRFPDNNGNYEPSNVQWRTRKQNARNRRNNRLIEYRGETLTLVELSEKYNLPYDALNMRLLSGMGVEKAIETPFRKRRETQE